MTRGHGWSLSITMRGTFTPYSLPAFTGAFDLTPLQVSYQRGYLSSPFMSGGVTELIGFCVQKIV